MNRKSHDQRPTSEGDKSKVGEAAEVNEMMMIDQTVALCWFSLKYIKW